MVGVEVGFARQLALGAQLAGVAGEELLDLGARVPHQLAGVVPDGERAAAVRVQRVVHQAVAFGVFRASGVEQHRVAARVLAVALGPGDVQAAELVVCAAGTWVARDGTAVAKHSRVQQATGGQCAELGWQVVALAARPAVFVDEVFDAELFDKTLAGVARPVGWVAFAPGTCVAFVGGDEVGFAAHGVRRDAVGQVQAAQAGPGLDVGLQVGVGHIEFVAGHAVVLVAQCDHIRHFGCGDVDFGQGIVFLQRDPGSLAVGGHGDVLGLEVLGSIGARAKDAHTFGAQRGFLAVEGGEVGRAGNGLGGVGHVDHTHRAFGVDLVVVAGLTFVGHQHGAAIGREGDHIGQGTYGHAAQQRQVAGLVQRHTAVVGLHRGLDRHGDDAVVYGHAVDLGPCQHGGGVDAARVDRLGRVCQVQHVHGTQLGVDHKTTFGCGIKRGDFCGTFAKHAGAVAADFFKGQARRCGFHRRNFNRRGFHRFHFNGLGCNRRHFNGLDLHGGGLNRCGFIVSAAAGSQGGCGQQGHGEVADRRTQGAQKCHGEWFSASGESAVVSALCDRTVNGVFTLQTFREPVCAALQSCAWEGLGYRIL